MKNVWQQPLSETYRRLSDDALRSRIRAARAALGSSLVILGHHYQQDDVVEFADFAGDSFELSRRAAAQKNIRYVVFCGVHFMAESADILTPPDVQVILPDLGAGCSMADMANMDQAVECWEQIQQLCPHSTLVPITYINSSAAVKSFVGEHGGAVCTSSNCRQVLQWALAGGAASTTAPCNDSQGNADPPAPPAVNPDIKVLFLPDQHLGRNTAYDMGFPLDSMVVWDPTLDLGGNAAEALARSKFILWKGHCSVHQLFRPEHIEQVRQRYPNMKVIVHPECRWEVVRQADLSGSTSMIVRTIDAAPPGSQWAVGTEVHLVNRLARQHPEQKIIVLSDCQCLCTTMFRIDLPHLCWVLEELVKGNVVNRIQVDDHTRQWATVALERMLSITAGAAR
jgi:quinolinate synthase